MEKRSLNNWLPVFFRLSILVFALSVVVYAMRYTKSDGFIDNINAVFGLNMEKPIQLSQESNWCPDSANLIISSAGVELTETKIIENICRIVVQSISKKQLENIQFTSFLTVKNPSGEMRELEISQNSKIFRAQGLVFGSDDLAQKLSTAGLDRKKQ